MSLPIVTVRVNYNFNETSGMVRTNNLIIFNVDGIFSEFSQDNRSALRNLCHLFPSHISNFNRSKNMI